MNRQSLQVLRKQCSGHPYTSFLSAPTNQQLVIHSLTAYNGIDSNNDIGLAKTLNDTYWGLGNGDSSIDLKEELAKGLPVDVFTEGMIIHGNEEFDFVGLKVASGSPVNALYEYWNGLVWEEISLILNPDFSSVGVTNMIFSAPSDWEQLDGTFQIRITTSVAPASIITIDEIMVANLLVYRKDVLPFGHIAALFENERQLLLQQGESIIAYFNLPWFTNTMEASYQINP